MGCSNTAYFMHCFWSCPAVQKFESEAGSLIFSVLGIPNTRHPNNCLLVIFATVVSKYMKRLLRIRYFYTKKAIVLSWKGMSLLVLSIWIKLINDTLSLYRLTFERRNGPKLYDKLWGKWISSPLIANLFLDWEY